jgi:hypothetical protein
VRFGYDLFEHEHPWDGEWIDDAFEAAAIGLRATVAKLLRALEELDPDALDAERTPLALDLAMAYVDRVCRDIAVAVPCCFGTEGRSLAPARGDLVTMAGAVRSLDPASAGALARVAAVDLSFATHAPDLYNVLDSASGRTPLPKATARLREESLAVTTAAIDRLDGALASLAPAFDDLLRALQHAIAARAEDGDDLLERWARTDWAVVAAATPGIARHLPNA